MSPGSVRTGPQVSFRQVQIVLADVLAPTLISSPTITASWPVRIVSTKLTAWSMCLSTAAKTHTGFPTKFCCVFKETRKRTATKSACVIIMAFRFFFDAVHEQQYAINFTTLNCFLFAPFIVVANSTFFSTFGAFNGVSAAFQETDMQPLNRRLFCFRVKHLVIFRIHRNK